MVKINRSRRFFSAGCVRGCDGGGPFPEAVAAATNFPWTATKKRTSKGQRRFKFFSRIASSLAAAIRRQADARDRDRDDDV